MEFDELLSPVEEVAGLFAGVLPISFEKWSDIPEDYFEEQWNLLFKVK